MSSTVDNPFVVFAAFLIAQWVAAYFGDFARGLRRPARKDEREDLDVVQTAMLTLLGLIIGFSFSMAVTRYDLRNNYEEAEANALTRCRSHWLSASAKPLQSASHPAFRRTTIRPCRERARWL